MTIIDDLTDLVGEWSAFPNHWAPPHEPLTPEQCADMLRDIIRRHSRPTSDNNHRILQALASGATTRDLANQLHLSLGGVNYHVKAIHRAYRVDTTVQAVTQALRAGHLHLDDIGGKWEGDPPSDSELHALQSVADHGTNNAAARAMGLKGTTVAKHLHHMTIDAGVSTKVQLVVRAYREGWVR